MRKLFLVPLAVLVAAAPAQAKPLKWVDGTAAGLPAGAKLAVVKGDPSKPGAFVLQAKLPANYAVPPHSHPTDEKVRVLSGGDLGYGMGAKLDRDHAGTLTKGYHVVMQAGMNHWVFNAAPATIEVSGQGPFAITYADPKDDPRRSK